MVVGHQPTLAAWRRCCSPATLPAGRAQGALWWFYRIRNGNAETVLRAVIAPDLA